MSGGLTALVGVVIAATVVAVVWLISTVIRERHQTAAVLRSMAEGAICVDKDGLIVSINPSMERLAGWTEAEVKGRFHGDVFKFFDQHGRTLPTEDGVVARAMHDREIVAGRGYGTSVQTRAGWRAPVGVTAAPIIGAGGELAGAVGIVRDVSQEREVDQLKSSLISMVSHELRTPLTMIQGFSELLLRKDMEKKDARTALEQINTAAQRLARLIDDLLSVSRIESGRLDVRVAPLSLDNVVSEVVMSVPGSTARDITIDIAPEMPRVLADHDKLVQILTNLVSNAIKYSPDDAPVAIRGRRYGATVHVAVEDKGIGLSEEDAAQLFEKFFRADHPHVARAGGTGLGLYIAKKLVELQGGRMWVETALGEGSTFVFTLPLEEAAEDERKAS